MGLWLAWGLARREGRAFFVDDSTWEYGNYSTFFQLPPQPVPACVPPPKEQRVPCPHQAAHLVVSEATTPWTFGAAFLDAFEDGREMGVRRLGRVFAMLRAGYEALWRLQEEDGGGDVHFLRERVEELRKEAQGGLEVGVHVRRGDRHPYEFQYSRSYVPVSKYLEAAREMMVQGPGQSESAAAAAVKRGSSDASGSSSSSSSSSKGIIVVASDDPDVYDDESVTGAGAVGAQHRLWLTAAWGGGFFPELFWSLGKHDRERMPKRAAGSPWPSRRRDEEEDDDEAVETETATAPARRGQEGGSGSGSGNGNEKEAMELRQAVARAYLLDMAVLGQADRVVCAVSSHSCRLLAVMMGWERAVEGGGWRNVDGDWGWRGLDW